LYLSAVQPDSGARVFAAVDRGQPLAVTALLNDRMSEGCGDAREEASRLGFFTNRKSVEEYCRKGRSKRKCRTT
jgi:hypothetical protein